MSIPKDILLELPGYLGLTGYLWTILWLLLLVSVSDLVVPALASLNPDSHLFKKIPKHFNFNRDWSYHVIWIGIIPSMVLLIYLFHGRAYEFIQNIFVNQNTLLEYKSNLNNLRGKPYIPAISLIITSGIAFLIYRMNRSSYIKARVTTWWFPNPRGKPALSTIFYHIWCAIIASTALVYIIHHVAITIYVRRLLAYWINEGVILDMQKMGRIELMDKFDLMVKYFTYPIYVLLPGVLLSSIVIGIRMAHLKPKFSDPVVIVTFILFIVGFFLLYFIPSRAAGLASTAHYATLRRPDIKPGDLPIWPQDVLFWWGIFGPIWLGITAGIGTKIVTKLTQTKTSQG